MGGRRILVAEDDGEIRQALTDILDFSGYAIRVVPDGATALAMLDDWQPDAILLDMLMPEMDGPTFLAALRARGGPTIPVVVLSAMRDLTQRAADLPVAAIVAKPFDVSDLLAALDRIWEEEGSR